MGQPEMRCYYQDRIHRLDPLIQQGNVFVEKSIPQDDYIDGAVTEIAQLLPLLVTVLV